MALLLLGFDQAHPQALPGRTNFPPARTNFPQRPGVRQTVSVDAREQLFVVLCALDAAGFDSSAPGDTPGRIALRKKLQSLQGPAVEELRKYYTEHALGDSGATFSRFVTFALVAGLPPNFEFELKRDDLPPEALTLEGFNAVLARFYAEAKIADYWRNYEPSYTRAVEALQGMVSNIVYTDSNYLREIVRTNTGRTFSVYVEPLAGTKTIFRTFGDQYAMVIRPTANMNTDDVRHAFLHFLLDPIAIRYRAQASKAAPLLEIAAHAPLLPVDLRDDFSAFFDECLVRAVELRLRHLAPTELAAALDSAEGSGYVLERSIYAGLAGFEKSEPAMSYYLPDLIKEIDVDAERRRLSAVKFADAAPAGEVAPEHNKPAIALPASADPADDDLAEGQRQITARNGTAAAAAFEKALAARPEDPRAIYGMAVASALQGKPEQAREYFTKVIAAAQNPLADKNTRPDASNLSWSHIYLGRMYDVEDKRDQAVLEYRAALAVEGAPESARAAARRGIDTGYQTPSRGNQDKQQDKQSDGKL